MENLWVSLRHCFYAFQIRNSSIAVDMNDETLYLAETIWNYMQLNQPVGSDDCMLVLGSRDDRAAAYTAGLSKQHAFQRIAISGGISHTQDLLVAEWGRQTEAHRFQKIYIKSGGVGEVLLEPKARNNGENALLSYQLLERSGALPHSLLVFTKPYMERRMLATFTAQWLDPSSDIHVNSQAQRFA